ncbi:MAG: hypothetical protein K0U34_07770, partial [Alphaproteobacteria bacterium]|nr:hypothetical protein [Alphaproteobacteria bacterium]
IAYNAEKGFNQAFSSLHIGVAAFVGCAFVGLTGFIVKPLRRTGVLTVPEFYGQRYGQDVRVFGAAVMALGGILNMGLFLKVAALFLLTLLGIEAGSSTVTVLMIALVVLAAAYTMVGGMRTVIATDVMQFLLMLCGLGLALVFVTHQLPLSDAITTVTETKGQAGFDPLSNDTFGVTYVLWMVLVAGVVSSAVWPTALSRALCIKDEATVSRAYLAASFIFMGRMVLPALFGVLAFSYFAAPTAPGSEVLATAGDGAGLIATPLMFAHVLPGWLVGFLAVALFASFMSTQDGYLFCWSSIIARDIAAPALGKTSDAAFQIRITRWVIPLIAAYEVYWGLVYSGGEDIWDYLAVSGSIYFCSGIVILAGGLYWQRASRRGALAALVLGFTAVAALGPVKVWLGLEDVSAPAIGFAAIALSLAGFIIGSLSERPT